EAARRVDRVTERKGRGVRAPAPDLALFVDGEAGVAADGKVCGLAARCDDRGGGDAGGLGARAFGLAAAGGDARGDRGHRKETTTNEATRHRRHGTVPPTDQKIENWERAFRNNAARGLGLILSRRLIADALFEVLDRLSEALSEVGNSASAKQENRHAGDNQ